MATVDNLLDHRNQNKKIKESLTKSILDIFPISSGGKRIEVSNINLTDTLGETDFPKQREVKLNRESWEVPITADLKMIDEETNSVISEKKGVKIGAVPKLTNRFSAIIEGNEYQVSNQLRRRSGVYSREKRNGELESEFNLQKGANFALQIDPEKQLFYITLKGGTRRYRLYTLLSSLGVPDSEFKKAWGDNLLQKNKNGALNTEVNELSDLYKKLISKNIPSNFSEVRSGLKDYFNNTAMDAEVTEITLGKAYSKADTEALLAASRKLLKINKGEAEPDERDSLIFKKLYGPDDLLEEHFRANRKVIETKTQNALRSRTNVRDVVSSNAFTRPIHTFFTMGDLASTPPQTNPVSIAVNARKTTAMGEGGITNMHSITTDTRDVHPSQFGFLDGLSTPEGSRVGVNVGLASEVTKEGTDMYTPVILPDGAISKKTPLQMHKAVVGFPDQFKLIQGKPVALKSTVKVMRYGKPDVVPKKDVDFWLRSSETMFDFGANLIPFLPTTQGNRGSTAARMITQALPLENAEAPLSVVRRDDLSTYEDLMGQYLLPTLSDETGDAKSKGVVEKIEDDYIHIKTDKGDTVRIGLFKDFPLNEDGFLDTKPIVKVGDKITGDQLLAKSNYTDDNGRLALGKNLTVAYVSYKGNSFEDAATITRSAAEKLSHSTIDRVNIFFNPKQTKFNKKQFRSFFPEELEASNARKLDADGLPKVGEKFNTGEAIAAFLVKKDPDDLDRSLKKLDKAIYTPYLKKVEVWDEDDPGEVVDVRRTNRNIDIYVKSVHPFKEGDKLCVDTATELLTDDGWKTITQLKGSEYICTLNPLNKEIEYQKIEQVNLYEHDGPMYRIANSSIDQLVTLEHNMYIKPRNPLNSNFIFSKPKDIFGKRVKYAKSGIWKGEDLQIPEGINSKISKEDFAIFLGWYLSEGNTNKTSSGYVTAIHQSLSVNPKNYAEIWELIKRMGLTPLKGDNRVIFNSKNLHYYLKQFGLSFEKFIPACIKESSPKYIKLFLDAYCKGDGTITAQNQRCFTTSSIKMRDDLMEIILKIGRAANYKLGSEKGSPVFKYFSNYDTWIIREYAKKLEPQVNHGHVHQQKVQVERYEDYKGIVGCPTTENGIIYIRRNGKTSWTGNSSRYGDKHIIGKIIPDEEAPHRPDGTPVDIMVNPIGVQGRMNLGQMLDTAAGKIALKEGKPFDVTNFSGLDKDYSKEVQTKLRGLGIEANEILTDGKNGPPLENPIYVGNRQYLKLRHLVKKKQGAHSFGSYDIDEQPAAKGAQKMGVLDTYAYLGHGAANLLREATTYKGQKNEEFFRNLQFGLPPSRPAKNLIFDKFIDTLRVAGVDTEKEGNRIQLVPLTDKKVEGLSKGELTDPGALLIGKNLASRKGGLFDSKITGGATGSNYSHISLPVRLPNPMAETAIKSILDLTAKRYNSVLQGSETLNDLTGPEAIIAALSNLDTPKELEKTKAALKVAPKTNVNKLNTKVRILDALDKKNLSPDEAYSMSKVLVIPPKMRPVYPLPSGDLQVSDINKHYRDVGLQAKTLKSAIDEDLLTPEDIQSHTNKLYDSIKALEGFTDPVTYGKTKYKGALKDLGETKKGLIFGKAWAKRQDLSGRSTIVPEPSFGLDEVGIPTGIAREIMKPFVVRKLKESGFKAKDALKHVKDNTPTAQRTLLQVMEDMPVILNRAPSLHKHSVQAFRPKLVDGKEIRLNPLIYGGYGADNDGDTMSVQVPVTYEGKQEALNMFPSKILFRHGDGGLVPGLSQEYLFGMSKLSEFGRDTGKTFSDIDEAKEDGLRMTDVFTLNGKKMTIGQWEINKVLPEKYRDYTRVFKGKDVPKLLEEIAKHEDSNVFEEVINHFKDLGALYAYHYGGTLSLDDLVIDRKYRDDILAKKVPEIEKIKDPDERSRAYISLVDEIELAQNKALKGKNRMLDLIDTGALSKTKAGNVRQVLSAPGIVSDTHGKLIPLPVLRSYSEGLDTFDYYNTLPGVRKGVVDKSVNTQLSGALNKQLLSVTRRLLISEEDCETTAGRTYEIDNDNILGRYAAISVPGVVSRNELITKRHIDQAKKKKVGEIKVRSPLTCETADGICIQCYGALPGGKLPSVGTNVGVLDSQALSERATQLTLQSFHKGGAASLDADIVGSFPRLDQLVKVPEKLSGKATLSEIDGIIKSIEKNDIGGYSVQVDNKLFTVPAGRSVVIEEGDKVKKGDRLSDGVIKPQELGALTNFLKAQEYITNEIADVYGGSFDDKTIETVVRGISDNAKIDDAPEDTGFYRGDVSSTTFLNSLNKNRKQQGLDPIKFTPYFKSIDTSNTDKEDWFSRITTNRVKAGLAKGMARMQWADIAGKDPIPAYIYGEDFGLPGRKRKDGKGFY